MYVCSKLVRCPKNLLQPVLLLVILLDGKSLVIRKY